MTTNESGGCSKCLTGCFASKQLADKNKQKSYLSYSLFELFIYLIYLVIISVVTFGTFSSQSYYFTKVITELFIDAPFTNRDGTSKLSFRTSIEAHDFWDFAESVLMYGIYRDRWQDEFQGRVLKAGVNEIGSGNKLLGRPRIRQLRNHPSPCIIEEKFRTLARTECYLPYEKSMEVINTTCRRIERNQCVFQDQTAPENSFYWGIHNYYNGKGVYINLETTETETRQMINELQSRYWINRATRAIFVDFTLYNPNINLFAIVKLVWEFHTTGGVTTSWVIYSVRLERYTTLFDYIILGFQIAFCVFTFYYFLQEIVEMCQMGAKKYFHDIWSWVDLLMLIVSFTCITFDVYAYLIIEEKLEGLIADDPDSFIDFQTLGYWESHFHNAEAICLFLAYIKIFKYVSFNKTMGQISITIARCYKDIAGFSMMFFIIFFGFTLLGHFLFGYQLRQFSTVTNTVFTLLRFTLGNFEFVKLQNANRILGPLYFFSYTLFIIFILTNMFLAIINQTYDSVLAEIEFEKSAFEVVGCFQQGCCKKKKKSTLWSDFEGTVSHAEMKNHLRRENFTELEAEMFLARQQLDENHTWDEDDTQEILFQLEDESYADIGTNANNERALRTKSRKCLEELSDLELRIASLESMFEGVGYQLDRIFVMLDKE